MRKFVQILMVILMTAMITPTASAQKKAIVKEVTKSVVKQGAKNAAIKHGRTSITRQLARRSSREAIRKVLKKQGLKSFSDFTNRQATIKASSSCRLIGRTGSNTNSVSVYGKAIKAFASRGIKTVSPALPKQASKLSKRITRSKLYKEHQAILAKGPIQLSEKEKKNLLDNPHYLREYIRTHTGDHKNFQEFFSRLSLHDKEYTKTLLSNAEIRTFVDRSIRRSGSGGVHEWLMTKNYSDFLLNPKWGEDGKYLSLALTKFVQKTSNVKFKGGGGHGGLNSTRFHNGLSNVISNSNNVDDLFINVRKYARHNLTKESYQEFNLIFKSVFE